LNRVCHGQSKEADDQESKQWLKFDFSDCQKRNFAAAPGEYLLQSDDKSRFELFSEKIPLSQATIDCFVRLTKFLKPITH
jgi:hypothetical protein